MLYYGDIRPDRYDTKHIYDTTYDNNADVDGTRFVTFDILSILSNMLNPWHTISRLDDPDRCSLWKKGLEIWGDYCAIIGHSITTPNSILPFYSVDVMLLILKNQYRDIDVDKSGSSRIVVYKEYKRIIDNIRDGLYNRNKIDEIISKGKMEIDVDYDKELDNHTYKVKAVITRKTRKEKDSEKKDSYTNITRSANYNLDIYFTRNDEFSYKIVVDDKPNPHFFVSKQGSDNYEPHERVDRITQLFGVVVKNVQTILFPLIECYWLLTSNCPEKAESYMAERISLPDRFRDHCISIILSEYKGGKKDRDTLIKGLKKYNTISEMYKYLVDQLWENSATETLIRHRIQIRVRINNTVSNYYTELFKLLKSSFYDDTQQTVYEKIFDEARKLFIYE